MKSLEHVQNLQIKKEPWENENWYNIESGWGGSKGGLNRLELLLRRKTY